MRQTSERLRLGVVTDLHFTFGPRAGLRWHGLFDVAGVLERLRIGLDWFSSEDADLLVVAGDLSHRGEPDAITAVLREIETGWHRPVVAVAGNHDVLEREDAISQSLQELTGVSVVPSEGILLKGVRVGCLSSSLQESAGPLVAISHYPVLSAADAFIAQNLKYAGDLSGDKALLGRLRGRLDPTLILAGHLHARDVRREGSVLQVTVGALVEAPFEVTMLEVTTRGREMVVQRRFVELGSDARPTKSLPVTPELWTVAACEAESPAEGRAD